MRLIILVMIFITILLSCQTSKEYISIPLSTPPRQYYIPEIESEKDLLKAYQYTTIHIAKWQKWFNLQVGSNYFNYSNK